MIVTAAWGCPLRAFCIHYLLWRDSWDSFSSLIPLLNELVTFLDR
jgi:hypothetical protein